MTAGEKIAAGGIQYVHTWDNKPPLISWFYALFAWAFGDSAFFAIRVFTCVYLAIAGILLTNILVNNKLVKGYSSSPAIIFLLLCAVPWYAQELNAEMLMLLPVIGAFYMMVKVREKDRKNVRHLFLSGLLVGIATMIKYQGAFIFLALWIGYLIVFSPKISDLFSLFSGYILALLLVLLTLYFTNSLHDYWQVGFLYNIDYIRIGRNPGESVSWMLNTVQYLKLWGVFLLFGLIGLIYYRLNYFSHSIRLRKIELLFFIWFIAALASILIGFSRMYLHYFIMLVPPLTMYVAKFFELRIHPFLKRIAFLLGLVFPIFTYGVFVVAANPSIRYFDKYLTPGGWTENFRTTLNEPHMLASHIDKSKVRNGILILGFEPELYQRLDVPCATKYTNFSMAYFRLAAFDHNGNRTLVSGKESVANTYRAFSTDMPEYIVELPANVRAGNELFPQLEAKMPLLFQDYDWKQVNYYKIYCLK